MCFVVFCCLFINAISNGRNIETRKTKTSQYGSSDESISFRSKGTIIPFHPCEGDWESTSEEGDDGGEGQAFIASSKVS